MATLYRKYRPQNFEEVVGQNHIKLTLEHELKTGQLAHAYLFCGPRAVGKTTLARVFCKALNCQQRLTETAEPCNQCLACQEITEGRALDVIEIDAASHTGVDNVRDNIIAAARVTPLRLKFKIFIIDEAHMLSGAAFNALLKIMEEPPSHIVFILCTTEAHKVPTTVISRCQRFDFKKISLIDMVKKLDYIVRQEKINISPAILENIARQAGGHMRDAESILGQIAALSESVGAELVITDKEAELVIPRNNLGEVVNLVEQLSRKDAATAIRLINRLQDDGFDLKIFSANLIEILRQLILVKINPELVIHLSLELGESLQARLMEINTRLNLDQLLAYIDAFIQAQTQLKDSFILQLPLELAIIEICAENMINPPVGVNRAIKPDKAETMAAAVILDQLELERRWPEVLQRLKQSNHSLSFILKSCVLSGIAGAEVCLTFKHKFHQERINEVELKKLIEKVLREVYGLPLTIKALLDENLALPNSLPAQSGEAVLDKTAENFDNQEQKDNSEIIDNLLKEFGGKVVG